MAFCHILHFLSQCSHHLVIIIPLTFYPKQVRMRRGRKTSGGGKDEGENIVDIYQE